MELAEILLSDSFILVKYPEIAVHEIDSTEYQYELDKHRTFEIIARNNA